MNFTKLCDMRKEKRQKAGKDKFNIISEDKIKKYTEKSKYTIDDITELLEKDKRTFFYKRKGDTEFTATEIWILTKIFNCKLENLIKKKNEMSDTEKLRYDNICESEKIKYEPITLQKFKSSNALSVSVSKKIKFNIISGDKIKHFMAINGYTSDKIAEELKKEKRTYFYKVKGETEFTATEIWILTKLLHCNLEDLLKDENEMTDNEKDKYIAIINKSK